MKILVTGGAGFVGSHLVEKLIKDHQVLVVDNLSMGKLSNLPEDRNLITIQADIRDAIAPYFNDVDVVFHLAALTRPRESFKIYEQINDINVNGTFNVLNCARNSGVRKFIFVSSASAYGFQETYPFLEDKPLNPASPYAVSKLMGEEYCKMFSQVSWMNINRIRPFNVYGKRQDPFGPYGAAVPKFINALKNGEQPYITGDGKQFRDFIYVEDVVDLMIKVMESDISGEVFNAGSGTYTTVNALYETISGIMKKNVAPEYTDPVNEPNTLASYEKAEFLLGWRPRYSLVEGLTKTI